MRKTGTGRGAASAADDEIEILEIVGMDPDAPAEVTPDAPARDVVVSLAPERDESRERYLRLLADFENYKRRAERDQERQEQAAASRLIARILPVLDNLERALAIEAGPESEDSLRDGVVLIFRQLCEELRREGLSAIDAMGQPFDPRVHEALSAEADSGFPPHTVVEEVERGYLLRGHLLRPARVRVSAEE